MEQKAKIAADIELTEARAQYDAACKRLLSHKAFLAWILKSCLEEYKDSDIETIMNRYIEGVPQVGQTAVDEDETNPSLALAAGERVAGLNTEHRTVTEGTVTYDIRFLALAPRDGTLMRIIVNVEAQSRYDPGYPLVKRGIYYASRMISAQKGVEFQGSEYGKIKKVCSIWICMNAPRERQGSITRYALRAEELVRAGAETIKNYDLLSVVMLCLGDGESEAGGVLRMLEVLLSSERKAEEKIKILGEEYAIRMSEPEEKEVARMCNLSQGLVEKGMAEGLEKGLEQGLEKGLEQGAFQAMLSSVKNLMANVGMSAAQAMDVLEIPAAERDRYFSALQ